jgi:hypothetical protein
METYAKWCSDRKAILTRALALVLISPDHESAINAAKDAFAQLADHTDPFAPVEVVQATEEARKAS